MLLIGGTDTHQMVPTPQGTKSIQSTQCRHRKVSNPDFSTNYKKNDSFFKEWIERLKEIISTKGK